MSDELSPEHQAIYDQMANAVDNIRKDLDPAQFLLKFTASEYYLYRFLEITECKELRVREISKRINLSHATIHKCIKSLIDKQLLEQSKIIITE